MKKLICVILIVFTVSLIFAGCSSNNGYATYGDNNIGITGEDALEIGKQEAVNHFCFKENVAKINISYGTEDVTRESDGRWKVHLLGYYYPVDDYGKYREEVQFAFTVHIDELGNVTTTFEY